MTKYFLPILLFLFLYSNPVKSEAQSDTQILEGLDLIYNLEFDDAEILFKSYQKNNPDDLKGYFYESLIYFYKALPSRDEKLYGKFLELSNNVISKAEKKLDVNKNDVEALYYKGIAHSYVSLLMLSLNKSLLEAASNGNDGYRILTAVIENYPEYYDAYMGLGLYKVALGFVPDKFKWLLSLIGFDGNIKDGVRLLNVSREKGIYTKVDSKVFLSIFSLKEEEEQDQTALNYSEDLTEEYPQSPVFRVFYSSLLLQFGYNEKAIENANKSLELNTRSFKSEIEKSSFAILGTAYFRLNDYDKSIQFLEKYMTYVNPEDRYNVYLFTLGAAYELSGNRSAAINKYSEVRNNFIEERDGELDKIFYRYSREKLKVPMNTLDSLLILALNLRESLKFEESVNIYEEISEKSLLQKYNTVDYKIKFHFESGLSYSYAGNTKKALEQFNKCITLSPENETWLVPHSYFEMGKIYFREGKKDKAEEMFEEIYEYDDFDFESFLDIRLANFRNKN